MRQLPANHEFNEILVQTQDILHRKPSAPAVDPARRLERAAREERAIARRVGQRDRVRWAVEADGVCSGDRSDARRRDVNLGAVSSLDHGVAHRERRSRRRVDLGAMMQLVNPGAEFRTLGHQLGRSRRNRKEDVDAEREVRRRNVTVVIRDADLAAAMSRLHDAWFSEPRREPAVEATR